jgi:F0F1-type ATP synthase delta subunit
LQAEVDPQWLGHVGPLVRNRLEGPSTIDVTATDGLGAGLRIRAGDACIDATVAGLLAARERIASELLAEFERQAAGRRAERAP